MPVPPRPAPTNGADSSETELHVELESEREFLAHATAAMADMYASTDHLTAVAEEELAQGDANLAISDITTDDSVAFALGKHRAQRLADLRHRTDIPLFFGRLWMGVNPDVVEEDYHIGRRHIRDQNYRPLVLDWRARVAERYYRASVHQRQEVIKRRRFGFADGQITGFEDEDLTSGIDVTSDILATEIERPRTGPMRDIVATIQPEQDELIRRPVAESLCVQGAPGTGKTAVGLHRAAWLLYTYREQLSKNGLLIIGPNDNFLRYISQVLPTLGEATVRQLTIDRLLETHRATHTDSPAAEVLKHSAAMADVLKRAVWLHVGDLNEALGAVGQDGDGLAVSDGGWRWRLGYRFLADLLHTAQNERQTYLAGRDFVKDGILRGLRRQAEIRTGDSPGRKWETAMTRTSAVASFLDSVWPRLKAKDVLKRLYVDGEFRARCTDGILSEAERELLQSPRKRSLVLSSADLILLDEIDAQLSWANRSEHIVLDEAQDLSPMQARAIARRCAHGSVTVLGDLAQGTTPWSAATWPELLHHLGKPHAELCELTTGYRVPQVIVEVANQLLTHLEVEVEPARSIRSDGMVEALPVADPIRGAAQAVEKALAEEGLVGVIARDEEIPALRDALPSTDRVELVPASLAKGLEYDHVIVVEPAEIAAVERIGLRLLYVAITRAVSRLTVVHSQGLPPQLTVLFGQ